MGGGEGAPRRRVTLRRVLIECSCAVCRSASQRGAASSSGRSAGVCGDCEKLPINLAFTKPAAHAPNPVPRITNTFYASENWTRS